MAVRIQKYSGETAYFYPLIRNNGASQQAVVNIRVGDPYWWILGDTFDMPADSERECELSGVVFGDPGVYDVAVRVYDVKGETLFDEVVFPGEFEVIEQPVEKEITSISYT